MTDEKSSSVSKAGASSYTVSPESLTIRYVDDVEFDVFDFLGRILSRWRWMALAGLIGLAFALTYYFLAEWKYSARLVASVQTNPYTPGEGAMGTGSLVSLALGGTQTNDRINDALLILRGQSFPHRFAVKNGLLRELFAERWDADNNRWLPEPGPFGLGGSPKEGVDHTPTEQDVFELFGDICTVESDASGGFLVVSVTWKSPEKSVEWVRRILQQLNREMWERDVSFSQSLREALYEEVRKEQILEIRQALFDSISRESEKLSYAGANNPDDYIFSVIDGPILPDEPSSPRLVLLVVAGVLLGSLLALFVLLIREVRNTN